MISLFILSFFRETQKRREEVRASLVMIRTKAYKRKLQLFAALLTIPVCSFKLRYSVVEPMAPREGVRPGQGDTISLLHF